VTMGFIESANTASFTIPCNMFRDNRWKFDPRHMENLLTKELLPSSKK
jgi:hypothetical protein